MHALRSRVLLVAMFSLVLLLSIVPTTSAPPGARRPRRSPAPFGNAMAVWDQFGAIHKDAWANRFDAVTGWGTPVLLETDNAGEATGVQVAMSASGYAIAAWQQVDGQFRSNIWTNVYSPGTGWGTATLVEFDDAGDAFEPQVAMDAVGNAIAVWYHWGASVSSVWSSYFEAGV